MAHCLLLNGHVLDIERAELRDPSGRVLPLRPQALSVLLELARRPGEVVAKRDLMARVWPGVVVTDDSLVQCVVEIRRELGDARQRIVRTVPRRGYLLIADHGDRPVAPATADRHPLRLAAGSVVVIALLACVAWAYHALSNNDGRETAPDGDGAIVAVLPLRELNSGTGQAPDGEALAYLISGELARYPNLRVVSTMVASELRAKGVRVREIGSMTGARYVVDGSVERHGDRLGLEIHLVDTSNDRIAWTMRFDPAAEDLPGVTHALVERIGGSLGSTLRELGNSAALARAPVSLDAHALALHGIALSQRRVSSDGLRQARRELEEATRLDPGYARAWAHLGRVKALSIFSRSDPELTPADHVAALGDIRRAIALDPYAADSWRLLSYAIDSTENAEEALQAAERAVELGPGDPDNRLALGVAQYHAGRIEAALRNVEKAISWNRGLRPPPYTVAEARLRYAVRDYDHAMRSARDCMERLPALVVCKAIWLSSQVRAGHASDAEAAWPRLVTATPWLESYQYAPRNTPEAHAIDADLNRLRAKRQ